MRPPQPAPARRRPVRPLARAWDQLTIYLPAILMGMLALGTYWLARYTPAFVAPGVQSAPTHEPDYIMRGFSVKNFDPAGRLKSEVYGVEARHYPDTDTLEIDKPRIRTITPQGVLTVATAERAITNADGSQVQLLGNAVVTRESPPPAGGAKPPPLEIRGEFLHAFLDTERIRSHKPVVLQRGGEQFTADAMDYDNLDRVMVLEGRVRGIILPRAGTPGAAP